MSSKEERHEGMPHRKKAGLGGAEQWGDSGASKIKVGDERQKDFDTEYRE